MENKLTVRSRAEEKIKRTPVPSKPLSPQETQHLIDELQLHQIEVEIQNEDLRSSQSQLEALLSRYTDLYDSAPIGYCTLDKNGLVLEVNLKGAELIGIERGRLIGRPFSLYVAEEDRSRFRTHLNKDFEMGARKTDEFKLNSSGGNPFDARLEESVGRDVDGRLVRRIAIIDITRQKRAEEAREKLFADGQKARLEAEEAVRLKDEFLAIVSHELRTPLNTINGWANLLRTGALDPETQEAALEAMERNVKAQEHLIDDLLDLSRIITGKLCLKTRPLNPAGIIEAAIETLQPAAKAKGIQIQLDIDHSIEPVMIDPDRLQQVLWNLLSNAIKFTPEEGSIEIFLERVDPSVQIRIKDNGIGIPSEFLPYLFDPFRQADGSNTRSHGGLGLGLTLVRHLVELHGGTVSGESDGAEKGATFIVRLPIRAAKRNGLESASSL